ncbi:lipopolysaccharide assembly protein LapA domain-containing protein [Paenibacillus taichungensis]|uniref:LapA family protein n=1 Tax=Paenibacillus taichungensis TaxID=484184 RepID=UPI002DB5E872|nr:lipopolysaccharide assembly protein LapA domain-containing protein [Paenibacillus taichungensis]MEC0110630.1 lipopolysaccharide assembly protein LapA domain-containing protein [Paenibacillus taichungensis]MEC0197654.1 lipopolysaccharide assembly protein LapA domain-containing protein [Paenibacillus taichungensis]
MKMQWALIAGLVFALLTGIFAVINVDSVQVNLLFNTVQIPLILLILGCTLIGGIIVGSYGIFRQYRLQRENKQLKLRVSELESSAASSSTSSLDSFKSMDTFGTIDSDNVSVESDSIQSQRKGNPSGTL